MHQIKAHISRLIRLLGLGLLVVFITSSISTNTAHALVPTHFHIEAKGGTDNTGQRQVGELEGGLSMMMFGLSGSVGMGLLQNEGTSDVYGTLTARLLWPVECGPLLIHPHIGFGIHASTLTLPPQLGSYIGGILTAGTAFALPINQRTTGGHIRSRSIQQLYLSVEYRLHTHPTNAPGRHQFLVGFGFRHNVL